MSGELEDEDEGDCDCPNEDQRHEASAILLLPRLHLETSMIKKLLIWRTVRHG